MSEYVSIMLVFTTVALYMIWVCSYDESVALAPGSVYVEPNSTTVLFAPFSVMFGGIVSMIMLEPVKSSCVILAAYSVEFTTKISNERLPFVSF